MQLLTLVKGFKVWRWMALSSRPTSTSSHVSACQASKTSGRYEARDQARRAHASLLGLALGAVDLSPAAAFVRLEWHATFEIRVVAVLNERWAVLADGPSVEHLQPWAGGLPPSCFYAWQPHLTQLAPKDGTELCLIDIVYARATFGDLWTS
jgi:hypothetical protein